MELATESPRRSAEKSRAAEILSVAILAPTGSDGVIAEKVLAKAGLSARVCADMQDVCRLISGERIGVLVLAEEALASESRTVRVARKAADVVRLAHRPAYR